MKVFKVVFYCASLFSFILSFIDNSLYLNILGVPFQILLLVSFHEFGHVFTCILTHTKINCIEVLGFKIENGKFFVTKELSLFGRVNFNQSEHRVLILMAGLFSSLIASLFFVALYCFGLLPIIYLIVALLFLFGVLLPVKESDMYKILKAKFRDK